MTLATHRPPHLETPAEERLNAITHGLGVVLGFVALTVLATLADLDGDSRRLLTVSIYGSSMVLLYLASTSFHVCPRGRLKHWLLVLDHIGIYTLIAGTYTPFLLATVHGEWGWSLFALLWGVALVGMASKVFAIRRHDILSTLIYVIMGWIGVIGFRPLLMHVPGPAVVWLVAGGLAYTAGLIFFFWDDLPYNHAVWHIFVLAGSACHFQAILLYVLWA